MQTHHDKLGVNSIDEREQGELVRCPRCHSWLECYELGDYFCRKCRPLKQEMSRVDNFFKQLESSINQELWDE